MCWTPQLFYSTETDQPGSETEGLMLRKSFFSFASRQIAGKSHHSPASQLATLTMNDIKIKGLNIISLRSPSQDGHHHHQHPQSPGKISDLSDKFYIHFLFQFRDNSNNINFIPKTRSLVNLRHKIIWAVLNLTDQFVSILSRYDWTEFCGTTRVLP